MISHQKDDLVFKSFLFPPISYFCLIKNTNTIEIDIEENYQKRSFRNKYQVLSANGKLSLSVPLKQGKNNKQNIKEVLIAYDEDWQKNHVQTIKSCYGKAAYFEDYFSSFERLLNKRYTFLFDLNIDTLHFIINKFKLDLSIIKRNCFTKEQPKIEIINKPYAQVFEDKYGFVSDLSCLDLLYNMGPESKLYL